MKAVKFTFRTKDNRYPVSHGGKKVQWTADRNHALEMARGFGASHFIEMDSKGKILSTTPLRLLAASKKDSNDKT